jgi:hypothetical protein
MNTTFEPRRCINWNKNAHLGVLKMTAYCIFDHEKLRNAERLEARVAVFYPGVLEKITDEQGVTLQFVYDETLAEQGLLITANKLLQRADRTDRYCEFNEYWEQVDAAYAELLEDEKKGKEAA